MQDVTPVPQFPQDIENYAPWVAKHGLLAPYGECQCCCREKTAISPRNKKEDGLRKDHPQRFVNGHNPRTPAVHITPQLCVCGCGEYTNIVSGRANRYIKGHQGNQSPFAAMEDAFWYHCNPAGESECWNWNGWFMKSGYGEFSYHGKQYLAHRASWQIHNGPIPDGMHILHSCDNRKCTNPAHLRVGTPADNSNDMHSRKRNRQPKGEKAGMAKLTTAEVIRIRKLHDEGLSYKKIAIEYGLGKSTIEQVCRRETWAHIP